MTNNAADDEAISFTPISVPDAADRARARRRNKLLAGAVAVLVVAGGITAWAVVANGGKSKPTKHTAVIPKAFGAYTEAKDGDTDWTALSSVNTDITKGHVNLTYRALGDKAANISVTLDPPAGNNDSGSAPSDDALSALTGTNVDSGSVTRHPAGTHGGKIACTDIAVDKTHAFTGCTWQDKTAQVLYFPVLKHHTVVDPNAPADFRAFLDALKIEPKSN